MEVVRAEGPLLGRVLDEACSLAGDGLDRRGYGKWDAALMRTAWGGRSRQRFALVEGGNLLASAARYELRGELDGRAVQVCGIGSVFTGARHRGRGHAQVLLERLLDQAKEKGAAIALKFSRTGLDDEAQAGFEAIPVSTSILRVTESSRRGAPMTLVRGGEERDLVAIVAMGRARAAPFRFHLERDVDLVQYAITSKRLTAGLAPVGTRQSEFFIAEEGTTAAAYVVLSIIGRTWTIEECGDRDSSGARVGALLQALIAREPAEQRPTIHAWLPPQFLPPQVTVVSSMVSTRHVMVRLPAGSAALSENDVLYWNNDVF